MRPLALQQPGDGKADSLRRSPSVVGGPGDGEAESLRTSPLQLEGLEMVRPRVL